MFFSSHLVHFRLGTRKGSALLLVALGIGAAALGAESLRVGIAAVLGRSLDLRDVQAAIALDPQNPRCHRRLGQVYLFTLENLDAEESVRQFRLATELNPRLAASWVDLGRACDLTRDTRCADQAFGRALELNPMSPDLRWVIGNHFLLTERSGAALEQFRRLLELNPLYAGQIFTLCLRTLNDPELILDRVLPVDAKNAQLDLAFVCFLTARGRPEDAYRAWTRVLAKTPKLELASVEPYLNGLFDLGRYREAVRVWSDLERMGVIERPRESEAGNLIYNGGFERAPLNSGLDWHFRKQAYLALDFSDPGAHEGARSLRLDFTVERNEEYEPVYQIIPVQPNREYLLTASVRSDGITSDSGPRLRVVDPACSDCLNASSVTTIGTTPWHAIHLEFTTRDRTEFIKLSVWRPRGRTFPAGVSGSFWVDDIALKVQSAPAVLPSEARYP